VVQAELKAARAAGARLVMHGDPGWPAALADLADAPPFLWLRGDDSLLTRPMVALVGARNASSLGTRMARALAADLGAAGFTIVSGLARGIDAAAHDAALKTGTIAVLAGGVDVIYPAENTVLAERIAGHGALLSEQPIGLQPQARHFPARNRIVSGLARAVIVVEAAAKSGSLITARAALDQGREVMAVPGHPLDPRAGGCNHLIRDGAMLVRDAADVIEALGSLAGGSVPIATPAPELDLGAPAPKPPVAQASAARPTLRDTAALHRQILDRLGPSPVAEDQLIRDLAATARDVTPVLTELELDGHIARSPGGMLARVM
jgi:DNA processing protein